LKIASTKPNSCVGSEISINMAHVIGLKSDKVNDLQSIVNKAIDDLDGELREINRKVGTLLPLIT
jgi:hypothetical protein